MLNSSKIGHVCCLRGSTTLKVSNVEQKSNGGTNTDIYVRSDDAFQSHLIPPHVPCATPILPHIAPSNPVLSRPVPDLAPIRKTSKQENSLARTAAENYARAAASEASAAAASGSIVGEESEDQLETSTNSRANSLTPGGGEQERREGFAAPHYSGRDAEAGGAVGEQLGIPGKRSGEAFFRSAPARTEAGISDVDVGEKGDDRLGGDRDGGHGGGRGWGLRDPPAVDGSPASESEVDMLDFLQEAGQRRLREEAEEEVRCNSKDRCGGECFLLLSSFCRGLAVLFYIFFRHFCPQYLAAFYSTVCSRFPRVKSSPWMGLP